MRHIQGKIYLLGAFSLAGTSVITGRILSIKLSSFTITAISLGMVLVFLLPFYGLKTVKTIHAMAKSDWVMILFQAVFGIFLFRTFLLFGVRLTNTVEAGILTGTTPAITSLMALFFLKERLSGITVLGIGFTVTGIILLQGTDLMAAQFSTRHLSGNILIICAAASESAFNIISRKHKAETKGGSKVQIDPIIQTLLVSAIALLLSIVPAIFERPFASLSGIGWEEWFALVWYGLVVTALAFIFFYEGAKRCDAYVIAAFSGMIPLVSMFLSIILLKEKIGYNQCIGGFLIILSMVLIGKREKIESVT